VAKLDPNLRKDLNFGTCEERGEVLQEISRDDAMLRSHETMHDVSEEQVQATSSSDTDRYMILLLGCRERLTTIFRRCTSSTSSKHVELGKVEVIHQDFLQHSPMATWRPEAFFRALYQACQSIVWITDTFTSGKLHAPTYM
jgi:hypothetical protein